MVLHFNVTGESRKAMVKAIEQETGIKAKYLGMPSAAYEIGDYKVLKDGTLEISTDEIHESSKVIDACVMATGNSPAEWDEVTDEGLGLTITLPLEKVNVGNLTSLLEAKGELIKKALQITDLGYNIEGDNISFPWFKEVEPDESLAYTKFIAALCEMSVKQKRVTAKPRKDENEKYAFRCFLLRLGFIGDEYKADRKILLRHLDGSSAFKQKEA